MPLVSQKVAAEQLDITPRALREWMKEPGFPDASNGYDVAAVRRWRNERSKKGSDAGEQAKNLKLATAAQKLRIEKARADAAERAEETAKGNILPRDEFDTAVFEMLSLARDRLLGLPKSLCKLLPKSLHRKVQDEGGKEVTRILNEFAHGLQRLAEGKND